MKFSVFYFFIFVLFLSSCNSVENEVFPRSVFQIVGKLGEKNIVGLGVCIEDKILLTSAHVVPDDRYDYIASGLGMISVSSRSVNYDTALLQISSGSCIPENISKSTASVGDKVFASVLRGGDIVTLSGKIIEVGKQGIGYSENAKVYPFISRVVTDILFVPGDSGAPIFNEDHELIDIAHTAP